MESGINTETSNPYIISCVDTLYLDLSIIQTLLDTLELPMDVLDFGASLTGHHFLLVLCMHEFYGQVSMHQYIHVSVHLSVTLVFYTVTQKSLDIINFEQV